MASDSTNNEQFIFVQDSSMPRPTFRDVSGNMWLRPMSRLQVEHDQVRQVGPMLVLTAEDEEFIAFVKCRSVS